MPAATCGPRGAPRSIHSTLPAPGHRARFWVEDAHGTAGSQHAHFTETASTCGCQHTGQTRCQRDKNTHSVAQQGHWGITPSSCPAARTQGRHGAPSAGAAAAVSVLTRGRARACRQGEVLAWGINDFGQLGNGSTFYETSPTPVAGLEGAQIADVEAGGWHSLALTAGGGAPWAARPLPAAVGHGTWAPTVSVLTQRCRVAGACWRSPLRRVRQLCAR